MGFIRFLLIFLAVFYGLQLIGRWLIKRWVRRVQQTQGQAQNQQSRGAQSRRRKMQEGDVEVSSTSAPRKQVNEKIGDYVDFEEVP